MTITIREDDLSGPEIAGLLKIHIEAAARHTLPESIYSLGLDGLRAPGITFWTAWDGDALLGCGALRELAPDHAEIKSMHTAQQHRGKGVGSRILRHMLDEAQKRQYTRVSLETGSTNDFGPARALYDRFGFQVCGPFSDYREDSYSVYMTCKLTPADSANDHQTGET